MPAELTAGPELKPLTGRRQRFAAEYVIDFRGADAARRAGCAGNSAKVAACRWLKEPAVAAEIERLKTERLEELGVTRFSILRTAAAIAHANVLDYAEVLKTGDLSSLTREQGKAIKKLVIEEYEDKPEKPAAPVTMEAQPQGGALQRGSEPDPDKENKPRLKRRIRLELLPSTPALDLLGRHMNLWDPLDPDAPGAGGTNVQVNVIFDL